MRRHGRGTVSSTELYEILKEMIERRRAPESIVAAIDRAILNRVNDEREEVASLLLELEVESSHPMIMDAGNKRGWEGLTQMAVSVTRRRASKLLRDRMQDPNEE